MNLPLLGLTFVACVLEWVVVLRQSRWHDLTKPLPMILLILWYSLSGGWSGQGLWFGLGLSASLLGDILLLRERTFLPGMGAFFLAHVFYIVGLWHGLPPQTGLAVLFFVLVAAAFGWLAWQARGEAWQRLTRSGMAVPVTAYALILSAMTFSALLTLARPDWNRQGALLLALGAVLFFLSDAILAWDRFLRPLRAPGTLMIPYLLGQVGIAVGAWLAFAG